MCNICYGIGDCPCCGSDNEPDFEQLLDDELNAADDSYQAEREEEV
jgi:hypothetical protein